VPTRETAACCAFSPPGRFASTLHSRGGMAPPEWRSQIHLSNSPADPPSLAMRTPARQACFIVPGFEFGRPGRPAVSLFPSLSQEAMERREAPPADRRRLANPNSGSAARHGRSPVTRGCRFRARWPSNVGPGASRRSNWMPVVGHRILLPLRTPRSTTPSIERECPYRTKREQNVKCRSRAAVADRHQSAALRR
jgi:hypothetical protein